jgi:hypothetical protein
MPVLRLPRHRAGALTLNPVNVRSLERTEEGCTRRAERVALDELARVASRTQLRRIRSFPAHAVITSPVPSLTYPAVSCGGLFGQADANL